MPPVVKISPVERISVVVENPRKIRNILTDLTVRQETNIPIPIIRMTAFKVQVKVVCLNVNITVAQKISMIDRRIRISQRRFDFFTTAVEKLTEKMMIKINAMIMPIQAITSVKVGQNPLPSWLVSGEIIETG